MGLFDRFGKATAEPNERFWGWFIKNKDRIAELFDAGDFRRPAYAELTGEIKQVHEHIMPELTRDPDGTNVLVISADGRREAVEPVMCLFDSAPAIEGWRVERFRKPAPGGMRIAYEGLDIDPALVRVAYKLDPEKQVVHIALAIPGYVEADKRFIGVGFLYLDHTIGEYNTIMHTGRIDFMATDSIPTNAHLLSLDELRELIEAKFY